MEPRDSELTRAKLVKDYLAALELEATEPSLALLSEIIRRHVATFAFSSLGCRLGEELPLDFESLVDRIVYRRRGGYCFEQNGLLFEVLDELGFAPTLYLGRVIYNQDSHPGLTHRISTVELDGRTYLVDVGFGPKGPRIPVPLEGGNTPDGSKTFRVAEHITGELHLQVIKDGEYFSLYRFEQARYGQADCEIGHFYSHKHPDAAFVNHLVVSRIHEAETRSLRNLDYWVIRDSGKQNTMITTPEHLREILLMQLGVQVTIPEADRLFRSSTPSSANESRASQ